VTDSACDLKEEFVMSLPVVRFSHLSVPFLHLISVVLVSNVYSEYHINFVAGSWSWVYILQWFIIWLDGCIEEWNFQGNE
jgi:hypothetical protein